MMYKISLDDTGRNADANFQLELNLGSKAKAVTLKDDGPVVKRS
jgi:hypothetical protein